MQDIFSKRYFTNMLFDPVTQRYYSPDYNMASADNIQDEMNSVGNSSAEPKEDMAQNQESNE